MKWCFIASKVFYTNQTLQKYQIRYKYPFKLINYVLIILLVLLFDGFQRDKSLPKILNSKLVGTRLFSPLSHILRNCYDTPKTYPNLMITQIITDEWISVNTKFLMNFHITRIHERFLTSWFIPKDFLT